MTYYQSTFDSDMGLNVSIITTVVLIALFIFMGIVYTKMVMILAT